MNKEVKHTEFTLILNFIMAFVPLIVMAFINGIVFSYFETNYGLQIAVNSIFIVIVTISIVKDIKINKSKGLSIKQMLKSDEIRSSTKVLFIGSFLLASIFVILFLLYYFSIL